MKITYTDHTNDGSGRNFIGVWVDRKPAGRIRVNGSDFRAFTNKRAPGEALLGTFATRDDAGAAVAHAHKTLK